MFVYPYVLNPFSPLKGIYLATVSSLLCAAMKVGVLGKVEGKRRRERQGMRGLDGITDSMDMNLRRTPGDSKEEGSLTCCSPWGSQRVGHDLATEQLFNSRISFRLLSSFSVSCLRFPCFTCLFLIF